HLAAPVVPLPDQARVTLEGFSCRERLGTEVLPKAVRAAKCGDARGGRHARASERGHAPGGAKGACDPLKIGHRDRAYINSFDRSWFGAIGSKSRRGVEQSGSSLGS